MAMEMIIKNTFIDVEDSEEPTAAKRSSSVPRSFKPVTPMSKLAKVADFHQPCASDASTGDSDECLSVGDNEAISSSSASSSTETDDASGAGKTLISLDTLCLSEKGDGGTTLSWSDLSEGLDDFTPKTVLCLSDAITAEAKKERSRLSAKARLFEPVTPIPSIPTDMQMVLMAAQTALRGCPKITNVQMTQGTFGGTTTIVGNYAKGSLQVFELVKTLATVKMALLDAANESTNTYIMGYLKTPFSNVGANGFSGKIGSVSAMQEDTTCWDSYQKGFCPRQSTCRWCHPADHDLVKIVVMLNETHHVQHQ